jgi:hypothetical protein
MVPHSNDLGYFSEKLDKLKDELREGQANLAEVLSGN